jgi:hypothetical protein
MRSDNGGNGHDERFQRSSSRRPVPPSWPRGEQPPPNWAGLATLLPEAVAGLALQVTAEVPMQPTALGYFRVSSGTPDNRVAQLQKEIATYAAREGFTLSTCFSDHYEAQASGFSALVDALEREESRHVIVPALHHLARSPGIRLAMKELLERKTGAYVVVMHPSPEEPS